MQLSCLFANFIIPLLEGVEIEIDLVWLPWRSSLLAFFKIGSNILRSGCNKNNNINRPGMKTSIINREASTKHKAQYKTNLANLIFEIVMRVYWYVILKDIDGILWLLISLMVIYWLILITITITIPLPPPPKNRKDKKRKEKHQEIPWHLLQL